MKYVPVGRQRGRRKVCDIVRASARSAHPVLMACPGGRGCAGFSEGARAVRGQCAGSAPVLTPHPAPLSHPSSTQLLRVEHPPILAHSPLVAVPTALPCDHTSQELLLIGRAPWTGTKISKGSRNWKHFLRGGRAVVIGHNVAARMQDEWDADAWVAIIGVREDSGWGGFPWVGI